MIYHKKCGNILRAEITPEAVKLLANFSFVGKFTAQITELILWRTELNKIPLNYFCTNCAEKVEDEDDFIFLCSNCGDSFPVKNLRIPTESGGLFCEKCSEKFKLQEKLYTFSLKDIRI
jgi:DNA-directed RNA polymerase subunit RPC12/RpoP